MAADQLDQVFGRIVAVGGVRVELFAREVAVLAKHALEVAAVGADGKSLRAGAEMPEGFLLDRVDLERTGVAVSHGIDLSAPIEADAAESGASFRDEAVAGTDQAAGESAGFGSLPVGGEKFVFTVHRKHPSVDEMIICRVPLSAGLSGRRGVRQRRRGCLPVRGTPRSRRR